MGSPPRTPATMRLTRVILERDRNPTVPTSGCHSEARPALRMPGIEGEGRRPFAQSAGILRVTSADSLHEASSPHRHSAGGRRGARGRRGRVRLHGPHDIDSRVRTNLIESGVRAVLAVPMIHQDRLIGCLGVTRIGRVTSHLKQLTYSAPSQGSPPWQSRTPGCSARLRTRAASSRSPASTSRSSWLICPTSCVLR